MNGNNRMTGATLSNIRGIKTMDGDPDFATDLMMCHGISDLY